MRQNPFSESVFLSRASRPNAKISRVRHRNGDRDRSRRSKSIAVPNPNSDCDTSREDRYRLVIVDEPVRFSVGLDDPRDFIADLERGLADMGKSSTSAHQFGRPNQEYCQAAERFR
jgi:hypothetical protein